MRKASKREKGIFLLRCNYSALKLFTGLAIAALIVCKLMVINAIIIVVKPAIANTQQLICIR